MTILYGRKKIVRGTTTFELVCVICVYLGNFTTVSWVNLYS